MWSHQLWYWKKDLLEQTGFAQRRWDLSTKLNTGRCTTTWPQVNNHLLHWDLFCTLQDFSCFATQWVSDMDQGASRLLYAVTRLRWLLSQDANGVAQPHFVAYINELFALYPLRQTLQCDMRTVVCIANGSHKKTCIWEILWGCMQSKPHICL